MERALSEVNMKPQNKKFIAFLESVKNAENANIINAVTNAFNLIESHDEKISEKEFEEASENFEDQLPGGLADNYKPSDFDREQLALGMMIELEHTADPKIALEIAMDHLVEHDDYYERLIKMEKEAEIEAKVKNNRDGLTEAKKDDDPNKICVEWDENMKCTKWERRQWAPFLGSRILGVGYPFLSYPGYSSKPDGGNGGNNGTDGGTDVGNSNGGGFMDTGAISVDGGGFGGDGGGGE